MIFRDKITMEGVNLEWPEQEWRERDLYIEFLQTNGGWDRSVVVLGRWDPEYGESPPQRVIQRFFD